MTELVMLPHLVFLIVFLTLEIMEVKSQENISLPEPKPRRSS